MSLEKELKEEQPKFAERGTDVVVVDPEYRAINEAPPTPKNYEFKLRLTAKLTGLAYKTVSSYFNFMTNNKKWPKEKAGANTETDLSKKWDKIPQFVHDKILIPVQTLNERMYKAYEISKTLKSLEGKPEQAEAINQIRNLISAESLHEEINSIRNSLLIAANENKFMEPIAKEKEEVDIYIVKKQINFEQLRKIIEFVVGDYGKISKEDFLARVNSLNDKLKGKTLVEGLARKEVKTQILGCQNGYIAFDMVFDEKGQPQWIPIIPYEALQKRIIELEANMQEANFRKILNLMETNKINQIKPANLLKIFNYLQHINADDNYKNRLLVGKMLIVHEEKVRLQIERIIQSSIFFKELERIGIQVDANFMQNLITAIKKKKEFVQEQKLAWEIGKKLKTEEAFGQRSFEGLVDWFVHHPDVSATELRNWRFGEGQVALVQRHIDKSRAASSKEMLKEKPKKTRRVVKPAFANT